MAFVETNGPDRALTFSFKPEVLNVPSAASADAFTTLRTDRRGALQSVEETLLGVHRIMRVKYLSFEPEAVIRDAPPLPTNRPVVVGKSFKLALQEEIIKAKEKGSIKVRI
jgi:hypothetical protein